MIEWREEGMVLDVRRHGETSAIVDAFTHDRGRHPGVVRGGGGRRLASVLQPGAQLAFTWRARLEEHLGAFSVEEIRGRSVVLGDPLALAALRSVTTLLAFSLPERQSQPVLYRQSLDLLDRLGDEDDWPLAYLHWERGLLDALGFGLDLGTCAVTGSRDDLTYVSPKSGRAVSREGAGEWSDRLLALPPCLIGPGPASASELLQGLRVTGHFLERWVAPALGDRPIPRARERLVTRMSRAFAPDGR